MATRILSGGGKPNDKPFIQHHQFESINESRLQDIWVSLLNVKLVTDCYEDDFTGGDLLLESTVGFFYKMKEKYKALAASYESTKNELLAAQRNLKEVSKQLKEYRNTPCSRCPDLESNLARQEKKLRQNDFQIKSIANILMTGGLRATEDYQPSEGEPAMARVCTLLTQMLHAGEEEAPDPPEQAAEPGIKMPLQGRRDLVNTVLNESGKMRKASPEGVGPRSRNVVPPVQESENDGSTPPLQDSGVGHRRSPRRKVTPDNVLSVSTARVVDAPAFKDLDFTMGCELQTGRRQKEQSFGLSGVKIIADGDTAEEMSYLAPDPTVIPETLDEVVDLSKEPEDNDVTMMPGTAVQRIHHVPTPKKTLERPKTRRNSSDLENSPCKRQTTPKSSDGRLSNSPSLLRPPELPLVGWKLTKTSEVLPKVSGAKRLRQTKLSLNRAPPCTRLLQAGDRASSASFSQFQGGVGPTSTEEDEEDIVPDSPENASFRISRLPKARDVEEDPGKQKRMPLRVMETANRRANDCNSVPKAGEKSPNFKYRRQAVRRRVDRQRLEGWDCRELLRDDKRCAEQLAAQGQDEPLLPASRQVRPVGHPSRFLESSNPRHGRIVVGCPRHGKQSPGVSSVPRQGYNTLETVKVRRDSRFRPPPGRTVRQRHSV